MKVFIKDPNLHDIACQTYCKPISRHNMLSRHITLMNFE